MAKQTFTDFTNEVRKIESEYLRMQEEYNWKYKKHEEHLSSMEYVVIVNYRQATKIVFDCDQKLLLTQTYYKSDIETITKLQGELV